jgi:hypothetical protein
MMRGHPLSLGAEIQVVGPTMAVVHARDPRIKDHWVYELRCYEHVDIEINFPLPLV